MNTKKIFIEELQRTGLSSSFSNDIANVLLDIDTEVNNPDNKTIIHLGRLTKVKKAIQSTLLRNTKKRLIP